MDMEKLAEKLNYYKNKNKKMDESVENLEEEIRELLSKAISTDYVETLINVIYDEVEEDILVSSAEADQEHHSEDDVKLAIGRVLLNKLGY